MKGKAMSAKYGAVMTYTAKQGNYSEARFIHAVHVRIMEYVNDLVNAWRNNGMDLWDSPAEQIDAMLPDGWSWISSGLYRCAYLSPKGTVYKVNRYVRDGRGHHACNYGEALKVQQKAHSLSVGLAIPASTLYCVPGNSADGTPTDYVLAVQAVDTSTPFNDCDGYEDYCTCNAEDECHVRVGVTCSSEALERVYSVISDVHPGNAYPDADGIIWIVDVG